MLRKQLTTLAFSVGLMSFLLTMPSGRASSTTVYYYNPDSNLTDYAGLKRAADGFLAEFGEFQFQPFRDAAVFDMHTLMNSDGITILPSWKYASLQEDRGAFFTLRPMWVGAHGEKSSQVRHVVALKAKQGGFSGMKIASSIGPDLCKSLLQDSFPGESLDGLKIVSVPRDSDAAFAVLFFL